MPRSHLCSRPDRSLESLASGSSRPQRHHLSRSVQLPPELGPRCIAVKPASGTCASPGGVCTFCRLGHELGANRGRNLTARANACKLPAVHMSRARIDRGAGRWVGESVGRMQHRHPSRPVGGSGGAGRLRRHVRAAGVLRRAGDQDVAATARRQRARPRRQRTEARRSTAAGSGSPSRTTFSSNTCAASSTRTGGGCPEPVGTANKIEIEVKWSEKAGTKRVVTDQEAEMGIGAETFGPAVPRLPVRAAVRRAALSPAPGHVGLAAAGVAKAAATDGGASAAGWRRRRAGKARRRAAIAGH